MNPRLIVMPNTSNKKQLPALLQSTPTAVVMDSGIRAFGIGTPIEPIGDCFTFAGTALTTTYGSLSQWKALEIAKPGDVIVIATQNRRDCAEFGEVFVKIAQAKGIAAIVTDGLIRDVVEIAKAGLPVFAAGVHPSSPPDPECGTIGLPVTIAGVQIKSGDAIVGDADGLAVICRDDFESMESKLRQQSSKEGALHESGTSIPQGLTDDLDGFKIVKVTAAVED